MKSQILAQRYDDVIFNGKHIANTNYHAFLQEIDYETAISRDLHVNSIAQLTRHVHYYINGVAQALQTGHLKIKDAHSFDFEPIQNETEWNYIKKIFFKDASTLSKLIKETPEFKLALPFIDEKYGSLERNINMMVEHCYYHLGQMVLLSKIIN
ncbi:hypothetical protein LX97_02455 [Nonlabens dokdonensis]|jgi:hypothetical protein|uniref:DUF1572 domain-containing protein n=2 Tax=Nonlabens dokdonensis TaxID=328515 RepID=L7W4T0_NONDD|nr:DinB family protein [Nonlabens dokdonensis]AGC75167.1 hypothetical protein DDD_0040 [Nonlabens dokdonensis DSW-6]PZX39089.1 hypothetical protein LX97_02455 [Nonlabens dokdonensis]